jgi:hypothetical protein
MFENIAKADRIDLAKARIERVLDHLLYVVELHANNEFVVYSKTLSSQIPRSYAANAFLVFQRSMYQIEVVRLCALWDKAEVEKENILIVVELIDDEEIIETLGDVNLREHSDGSNVGILDISDDPEIAEVQHQSVVEYERWFGREQAAKAKADLRKAIADSREIAASAQLASVMNARDKHLAHSLISTYREKKDGPVAPMKMGDEKALLEASIAIVEKLYRVITGRGFMIDEARETDQRNAAALWNGCKFDVLR